MKLVNTSGLKNEELREMIRFAKPTGLAGFEIRVTRSNGYRGRAYNYGSTQVGYCNIRRGRKTSFPHSFGVRGRGYLPVTFNNEQEILLYLIAHELRHLWQYLHTKSRRGWNTTKEYYWNSRAYREYDACTYGMQILEQWRREKVNV
jgi:hypothetical protein